MPQHLAPEVGAIGGVQVDGEDAFAREPDVTKPSDPAQLSAQLFSAFEALIKEADNAKFTARGIPVTKAVETLLGIDLTADQVKHAWEAFKAPK